MMMKEPKYKIGDVVFTLWEGIVWECEVGEIYLFETREPAKTEEKVEYMLCDKSAHRSMVPIRKEEQLFPTKQSLIDSL